MESRIDKITKELDEWIEALKSGNYKQGKYRLKSDDSSYCCLGVLAEVNGIKINNDNTILTKYLIKDPTNYIIKHFINTNNHEFNQTIFAQLNDKEDKSFEEIADYILENKEKFINIIDYELNKKGF